MSKRAAILLIGAAVFAVLIGCLAWASWGIYRTIQCANSLRAGADALTAEKYDVADECFTSAMQRAGTKAQLAAAHLGRGAAKNGRFKFDAAIQDLTASISLTPNEPAAYVARGYALQRKGELDAALKDYDSVLRLDPNAGDTYYNRGVIFELRREWDKAAADFDEAARCRPFDAIPVNERAKVLYEKGDLNGALASVDSALRFDPQSRDALLTRAAIRRARGEDELARQDDAVAAALAPKPIRRSLLAQRQNVDADARQLLFKARAAADAHDVDAAIGLYSEALGRPLPVSVAAVTFMNRGNMFYEKRDYERALRDYDEAIRDDPKNAGTYVDRANVYAHQGAHDKALAT